MQPETQIIKINIDLLIPNPHQPRKKFNDESLKELAQSIKEYGILNPILVRKKDNLYEIIAGERRYRAAKMIGLKDVPTIIKEVDDTTLAKLALIENLHREDISPIEEARAYQDIIKLTNTKETELCNMIGKSQSYISNKIRLLKLPENIQEALINKKISERHARSLINVTDKQKQNELLNRIIKEKLTVKELETIINEKEITDAEIKSAIDDIMKSLNIQSDFNEKKEEKESDKMNNVNFFPNQPNELAQNQTLNAMNMQTLNQMPIEPVQPQYTQAPLPTMEIPGAPVPYPQEQPIAQPIEQPAPIPTIDAYVPQYTREQPIMTQVEQPVSNAPIMEKPNEFAMPNPTIATQNMNEMPLSAAPVEMPQQMPQMETPLFNQNIQPMPTAPEQQPILTTPSFEVPVANQETPEAPQNKLADIEQYLNSNGINYKTYSNETGHCIIIEI